MYSIRENNIIDQFDPLKFKGKNRISTNIRRLIVIKDH